MKCKHNLKICKCNLCLSKVLSDMMKNKKFQKFCYVNAFVMTPSSSRAPVIRTLTQAEITDPSACTTIPLTSTCDISLLQLGKCKAPEDKWCRFVDRGNGFITSLVVPKGCGGCYNFDLSASVGLSATISFAVTNISGTVFSSSANFPLPVTVDLKLCEQLPREVCIGDELADREEDCFTSVTFPIIDAPCATETLPNNDFNTTSFVIGGDVDSPAVQLLETLASRENQFSSLAVSGTVCLKECQRLVPCLTIRPFDIEKSFNIGLSLNVNFTLTTPITLTDIKLSLSCLSLKLVRIGDCSDECDCKKRH